MSNRNAAAALTSCHFSVFAVRVAQRLCSTSAIPVRPSVSSHLRLRPPASIFTSSGSALVILLFLIKLKHQNRPTRSPSCRFTTGLRRICRKPPDGSERITVLFGGSKVRHRKRLWSVFKIKDSWYQAGSVRFCLAAGAERIGFG